MTLKELNKLVEVLGKGATFRDLENYKKEVNKKRGK